MTRAVIYSLPAIGFKRLLPLLLVLWFGFSSIGVGAANEFVIGVGVHLSGGSQPVVRSLDIIRDAGAISLRDDATWALVEEKKGILHIPSHWDVLVDEALARGIDPLLILDYGNKFYDEGDKPLSPEAVAAFTRYARFVTEHFKGRVSRYEIWNEWDHTTGNTTPGTAEDYVRLVSSVYPALKMVDPNADILVGALTARGIRKGFMRRIIELGLLDFADGLSLHTYMHCRWWSSPEDWAEWMQYIEEELFKLTGKRQSFYITEMGWPSHKGKCGISPERQAVYLEQMFLLACTMPFLKGIWWYDLQDDGVDSTNQEHNFGLLRADFSEKPAYFAFRSVSKAVQKANKYKP